jgi:hypothetical protein
MLPLRSAGPCGARHGVRVHRKAYVYARVCVRARPCVCTCEYFYQLYPEFSMFLSPIRLKDFESSSSRQNIFNMRVCTCVCARARRAARKCAPAILSGIPGPAVGRRPKCRDTATLPPPLGPHRGHDRSPRPPRTRPRERFPFPRESPLGM